MDARASRPAIVPPLADVDPDALDGLPVDALVTLRRQVKLLDAEIGAAFDRRMVTSVNDRDSREGEVLDKAAAARELGTSEDSLYRKRKRLRLGYIDPLDGRLKFTRREIEDYKRRQKRG